MISRDIQRVIISGATSSIEITLCEECVTNGIGYGKSKLLREFIGEAHS